MDNTVQNVLSSSFEVDSATYRDAMNEELVDNLELTMDSYSNVENSEVTDEVLRKLLVQIKSAGLAGVDAVDTFDKEVMDEVSDASLKNV